MNERPIVELYYEVKDNTFLPKKFRKLSKEQWKVERIKYLEYLEKIIKNLEPDRVFQ